MFVFVCVGVCVGVWVCVCVRVRDNVCEHASVCVVFIMHMRKSLDKNKNTSV